MRNLQQLFFSSLPIFGVVPPSFAALLEQLECAYAYAAADCVLFVGQTTHFARRFRPLDDDVWHSFYILQAQLRARGVPEAATTYQNRGATVRLIQPFRSFEGALGPS